MVSLGLQTLSSRAQAFGLVSQSFQVTGKLQSLSLVQGVFRQHVVLSLVEAGCTDLCSWLSLVSCQGQPAPAFSVQTVSPLPARTRISLSPSTLFPGLNMLFQAHSLICRFGGLSESSDLNGDDSVFKISFEEFPSGWRMIWWQSEIRVHGRHLLLLLLSSS